MKAYRKKINKRELYRYFLVLTNSLLQLTDRELDVLALLMQIQMEGRTVLGKPVDILGTDNRRLIMKETRINKNNLSKYIKNMKERGIILNDENGHYINGMFIPDVKNGLAEVLFVLELEKDGQNIY